MGMRLVIGALTSLAPQVSQEPAAPSWCRPTGRQRRGSWRHENAPGVAEPATPEESGEQGEERKEVRG